jgi:hypothetical protein
LIYLNASTATNDAEALQRSERRDRDDIGPQVGAYG